VLIYILASFQKKSTLFYKINKKYIIWNLHRPKADKIQTYICISYNHYWQ